ncbi:hypothetical protein BIV57_05965 [Mangrovactinospora gilvigrisea]|uniref:Uncharacterized protein n=1 Tax=Mangrovactinospora gilvigrisea TaxID=1428644 RepID=A0A1J7CFG1_9ACTN|nr:hypothetical protein [Mangrovactinospora gilvigrisea]OIV38434.1 hypothetical protein BIV57_05965 [Mangrovactinospora gilvigrisea]
MSEDVQPAVAEVRAAAEALKAALDAHLAAVESRTGESDPAVYSAYEALAAAADAYDELLYDAYDEVTPFDVVAEGHEQAAPGAAEEPEAISVLIRRDYLVAEPERLVAQAARVVERDADGGGEPPETVHEALGVLFGEYEPDEIASRSEEYGLEDGDSTLWVAAAEPSDAGEWLAEPFDDADESTVICRFDVSSVYEDDLDDELDDEIEVEVVDVDGTAEDGAVEGGAVGDGASEGAEAGRPSE